MKQFVKLLFVILAAILILCITGCSRKTSQTTAPTTATPTTEDTVPNNSASSETTAPTEFDETADGRAVSCQYLPTEVDNPEGLPVLKWLYLTDSIYGGGNRIWSEDAAVQLNQMLADRNMPFRLQFVIMTAYHDATHQPTFYPFNPYTTWFGRPEIEEALKDADLLCGLMTADEMQEYLLPITEYVNGTADISLENSVYHSLQWLPATVDGQIYGIPSFPINTTTYGYNVEPKLLQDYGLSEADLDKAFWEMDTLFSNIFQKNGSQPFMYLFQDGVGSVVEFDSTKIPQQIPAVVYNICESSLQLIGSCFAIDTSSGTPKVINIVEADTVRSFQEAVMRYKAAGYITSDPKQTLISYSAANSLSTYLRPSGSYYIPVDGPFVRMTVAEGMTSGICAKSEHQNEALSLLALIANDEAFRMQLFYGREGQDYTVTDGYYKLTIREDGTNYALAQLSPLSYYSGLYMEAGTGDDRAMSTATDFQDPQNGLQNYLSMLDNSAVAYPIQFDYSGLEAELVAVQLVINRFFPYFTTTEDIPDDMTTEVEDTVPIMNEAGYDQMLQAFKDAGSDKIVAELQKQLDEWLAENPDW